MIIVFGGAFQGKTDFAKKEFGLNDSDFFDCSKDFEICFDKKAIDHIEKFILHLIEEGENVFEYFEANADNFKDKIIICEDVCCGVVPIDKQLRLYRDNVGKQMQIFCRDATDVYRVFCGLGEKVK